MISHEMSVDDIPNNFSGKCHFKNFIETKSEKSVKNVFDMLLIFKLTEKRWSREGDGIFVS
jgi:hypothetical protein